MPSMKPFDYPSGSCRSRLVRTILQFRDNSENDFR